MGNNAWERAAARHERKLHQTYADALRVRIQQMAEAL